MDDWAVYRPSTGEWHVRGSSGLDLFVDDWESRGSGAVPVSADYDGDGAADIVVFEPGGHWSPLGGEPVQFGLLGDIPVPSDYDGDGATDLAVYRPSTGAWYVAGQPAIYFGGEGDVPVPADYDGDGLIDIAVYRPSTSTWYVAGQFKITFGQPGDRPVPLDVDGDGRTEIVVHRASEGLWNLFNLESGISEQIVYGELGDIPVGMQPFLSRVAAIGSADFEVDVESLLAAGPPWIAETQ